jgi:hypothetical protein
MSSATGTSTASTSKVDDLVGNAELTNDASPLDAFAADVVERTTRGGPAAGVRAAAGASFSSSGSAAACAAVTGK